MGDVNLLQPDDTAVELQLRCAYFAARRCRTTKDHDELIKECWDTRLEIIGNKVWTMVQEEWAWDILRHMWFSFDIVGYPQWFWAELGRHKFIKESIEPDQLSQRAVKSDRLGVWNPFKDDDSKEFYLLHDQTHNFIRRMREKGYTEDELRNASFQGVLVNRVISLNPETIHHLARMRGSKELVGEFGGKAAPLFQEMVGQMWEYSRGRCPWIFKEVIIR